MLYSTLDNEPFQKVHNVYVSSVVTINCSQRSRRVNTTSNITDIGNRDIADTVLRINVTVHRHRTLYKSDWVTLKPTKTLTS